MKFISLFIQTYIARFGIAFTVTNEINFISLLSHITMRFTRIENEAFFSKNDYLMG